ncbi:rod shape-determining protein RodA [Pectinatus frisingensis]|uniref:rod shape-determining protein RodA n=1 Tax=Pectinatus frisingensis TaxID=865 RepID=UPI0018C81DE8|nr:rod shape-determining protein RodA [Pectinatus frisingensis]
MFTNSRLFRRIDVPLIIAIIILILIGIVIIGSATHINTPSSERYWYVQRQSIFALVGAVLVFLMMKFDYRMLQPLGNKLYIFNALLLLAVDIAGHSALGAQRWIQLGPISFQPSEFSKLIMIISLAVLLENRVGKLNTFKELLPVALYMVIPFALVVTQPDLGTALVFLAIFFGMIFAAGVNMKIIGVIFGAGLSCLPIIWHFLKEYQKMRIMVFINPNIDPLGSGYHIIQSKIAIGSGLLYGKGLFHGTQSQLNFLPENHTDFIFAVIGEETGFIGAAIVLLIFLFILWRGIKIAREASDNLGMLLAVGINSMLAFHVLVNVGMTIGIMPVTGIPLPFISYGVSSLITNVLAAGLLLNIYNNRQQLMF